MLGTFEIVKDFFNQSARSSDDNKCCHCSKKGGSKGTNKESRGEDASNAVLNVGQSQYQFKERANASGNQIFSKLSPLNSPPPLPVFEKESPEARGSKVSILDQRHNSI